MEITPLQEKILEKLYEKAYKTEPSEANVEKYNDFIGNEKIKHMILDTQNEANKAYLLYFPPVFSLLMWYFWDQIVFGDQSFENIMVFVKIVAFALVVSLSIGYLKNIKRRKIVKLLKPYFIREAEIARQEQELKKISREQYRDEKEKELLDKEKLLREKYL